MNAILLDISNKPENKYHIDLLNSVIKGLKEQKVSVEYINISKLSISPCRGCTDDPVFLSNGKCLCEDDMQKIYPKLRSSDLWIFSLYNSNNWTAQTFINFLDRMEPLFQPNYSQSTNGSSHKTHKGKVAFISSSDNIDSNAISIYSNHLKNFVKLFNRQFIGSIVRPHLWAIGMLQGMGVNLDDIFNAAKDAGKQMVHQKTLSKDTLLTISRPLIPKNLFTNEQLITG
ncbi:MAG: NAD(P)H-dependent oxidoreductase [Candidatus Kapabacteria bacterium]|nr:NAD(P)H-dependent oxidoreductase [Candidatus Kapabacteria bacterium]